MREFSGGVSFKKSMTSLMVQKHLEAVSCQFLAGALKSNL